MIKVTRGPAPVVEAAVKELADAIVYFSAKKPQEKKFSFKAYKNKELSIALRAIFGTKCAYCESDFGGVTPREIEHFRPKSEIDLKTLPPLVPGYYWLACDWENLLVSCVDCNRARNHEVPGQPAHLKLGKGSQFPLSNEAKRIRTHETKIKAEERSRLLLNPCIDDPEKHFMYDDMGLIHPRPGARAKPSPRGAASIFVYALQRKELVEKRYKKLLDLELRITSLRDAIRVFAQMKDLNAPENILDERRAAMITAKDNIKTMFKPGSEYIGMLRDRIRARQIAGEFKDLEKTGIDLAAEINGS